MGRGESSERRSVSTAVSAERRGAFWSLANGRRLPNALEATTLALGDPDHPARLRLDDLEHPEAFHLRLAAWLMLQG